MHVFPDVKDDQLTAAADNFLANCVRGFTVTFIKTIFRCCNGLTGLFFEIQTKTRFPINFNWEISVAWVCTLHEQNLGWITKGLDFSPEIARSGCHKLMQYNRVGCLGFSYRELAKRNISH